MEIKSKQFRKTPKESTGAAAVRLSSVGHIRLECWRADRFLSFDEELLVWLDENGLEYGLNPSVAGEYWLPWEPADKLVSKESVLEKIDSCIDIIEAKAKGMGVEELLMIPSYAPTTEELSRQKYLMVALKKDIRDLEEQE